MFDVVEVRGVCMNVIVFMVFGGFVFVDSSVK